MDVSNLYIEKEIIDQFIKGDVLAFELIFHRTKGRLKGFLKKVIPHGADEESVLQEIYLKLWVGRSLIKADKNFEAYLYTIARNMVVDVMRKSLHKQKYLEELYYLTKEGVDNSYDPLAKVNYSELEELVSDLLNRLPEKRKEIFTLNRFDGLTYKQISQKLNISENTVDTQIRKALDFFHLELKRYKASFYGYP